MADCSLAAAGTYLDPGDGPLFVPSMNPLTWGARPTLHVIRHCPVAMYLNSHGWRRFALAFFFHSRVTASDLSRWTTRPNGKRQRVDFDPDIPAGGVSPASRVSRMAFPYRGVRQTAPTVSAWALDAFMGRGGPDRAPFVFRDPTTRSASPARLDCMEATEVAAHLLASDLEGGAITAALFLRRFAGNSNNWAHIDVMAWNLASRPGRPKGGEAMGLRAVFDFISTLAADS